MKWGIVQTIVLIMLSSVGNCASLTSPDQFDQLVQQLQKAPDDNALREKIVNLVSAQNPKPAVPEDARRYLARGIAAVQNAKNTEDFKLALPEFRNATNVAPWWPDAYFNLALVQERLDDFVGAIANYHFYLSLAPNAKDTENIRTHTYQLEYLAEQNAKPTNIYISDGSVAGTARDDSGNESGGIPFDIRNAIEPDTITQLMSMFPTANVVVQDAGDAALKVTISLRDTAWNHDCGIFSCDVSVSSQLLISVASRTGLSVNRNFELNISKNVSKGNSSFSSRLFAMELPVWIGQEVLAKLHTVLGEDAVRTSLGNANR
jgi:hypothetical protein